MLPDYQAFMRPLVDVLRQRGASTLPELREGVSEVLGLGPEAKAERMKWDGRLVLDHRLEMAAETLEHAEILRRAAPGWHLTPRGQGELPTPLDVEALMVFPEFKAYRADFEARRGA